MPVENASNREARQQNRRSEFLDAAREIFFLNGYRATTMQQITAHAGYSKRAVYLDYQSKDDLFLHIAAEGMELLLENLQSIPIDELEVETCLKRITETQINFSRDHWEYFRICFSEATPEIIANSSEDTRNRVRELEHACLYVIVNVAERAIREKIVPPLDPWEAAGIFVGTVTGIILLSMGGSQTVFSKEALESLVFKAIWAIWTGLRSQALENGENNG